MRLVQEWSRDAKGPALRDAEAEPLARLVLDALASPSWRREFDAGRKHDADLARERRVATAIKILQEDLPRYIERWRSEDLPVELSRTLALKKLAYEHQPLIDAVPQLHERKPGGPPRQRSRFVMRSRGATSHSPEPKRRQWTPSPHRRWTGYSTAQSARQKRPSAERAGVGHNSSIYVRQILLRAGKNSIV